MKKIISVIASAMLIMSAFAGCQKSGDDNESSQTDESQTEQEQTPESDFDSSRMINVISREDGSGTRGAFVELTGVQEKKDDGTKVDNTTKEAIIANKTDVVLTNVAGDDYAIGYISLGSLNDTVNAVSVDGVEASAENIKDESYKIARPFNIATKEEPTGLTADFIDFIMSEEGQDIVEETGYIKIDDSAEPYAGTKPEGKIVIAGSSSVTPVMEKLMEGYTELNPSATIEVQQSDSTAGMTAVIDGTCDIGMASRGLKESEAEQLTAMAIANDGIAVITSINNPMNDLSMDTIKDIFTGDVEVWEDAQ